MCLGISGLYLSKVYLEVKNRPLYISKEKCLNDITENDI